MYEVVAPEEQPKIAQVEKKDVTETQDDTHKIETKNQCKCPDRLKMNEWEWREAAQSRSGNFTKIIYLIVLVLLTSGLKILNGPRDLTQYFFIATLVFLVYTLPAMRWEMLLLRQKCRTWRPCMDCNVTTSLWSCGQCGQTKCQECANKHMHRHDRPCHGPCSIHAWIPGFNLTCNSHCLEHIDWPGCLLTAVERSHLATFVHE